MWRAVPGFERYEVSDAGRVRSLWGRGGPRAAPVLLTPKAAPKSGHLSVCLFFDGGRSWLDVAACVLLAFVGPRPDGLYACHRDDDPTNNRIGNLRWDTPAGNYADAVRNGTSALVHAKGEGNRAAKLTDDEVRAIRRACAAGEDRSAIGRRFGVGRHAVTRIHTRKRWGHVSD